MSLFFTVIYSSCIDSVCFCIFQKYLEKFTFLQSIFAALLVVLGPFWLYYVDFDDRYSYKPVSVTKKDISDQMHQLIYMSL